MQWNLGYKQYFLSKAAYNGWVKCGYNFDILRKSLMWMNYISSGKKLLPIFRMIYNFTIAIARIHFAICEVRSDNSNLGIFFINLANILIAHLPPNFGYLPKRYWWSKMIFHPWGDELKFTKYVSFYRIRKIKAFILKVRSNSKCTLIKTIRIVIFHGSDNGNYGYCG